MASETTAKIAICLAILSFGLLGLSLFARLMISIG